MHDEQYDEDISVDASEDEEGQCDWCTGSTAEDVARAAAGELVPVCACAIGQGAPPEECRCGPEED